MVYLHWYSVPCNTSMEPWSHGARAQAARGTFGCVYVWRRWATAPGTSNLDTESGICTFDGALHSVSKVWGPGCCWLLWGFGDQEPTTGRGWWADRAAGERRWSGPDVQMSSTCVGDTWTQLRVLLPAQQTVTVLWASSSTCIHRGQVCPCTSYARAHSPQPCSPYYRATEQLQSTWPLT